MAGCTELRKAAKGMMRLFEKREDVGWVWRKPATARRDAQQAIEFLAKVLNDEQEAKVATSKNALRQPLIPPPRIDAVYIEGANLMADS